MLPKSNVFVVAGLGLGDEGKGSLVDYLVRRHQASSVVCYTSGPQKAHHVVLPDGTWHCFSQFGSGMLVPGTKTHISSQTLFKPQNLIREDQALKRLGITNALSRVSIDPDSPVVTSLHALIGQMLEVSRGKNRYGSVGMGVGQAVLDWRSSKELSLTARDLFDKHLLGVKISRLWDEKIFRAQTLVKTHPHLQATLDDFLANNSIESLTDSIRLLALIHPDLLVEDGVFLSKAFEAAETLVLEGGQGTLLDPTFGFAPYVTKTPSTALAAQSLLNNWLDRINLVNIGVARAYGHRHGAGPFVTEELGEDPFPEVHNGTNPWQGNFRTGWFDLPAIKYAASVNPELDFLALTCVDRVQEAGKLRICTSYEYLGNETEKLSDHFLWNSFGENRIRITGIKIPISPAEERTRLLFQCAPLDYVEIGATSPRKIAVCLQDKLGIPIGIVSTGPTADHKIDLRRESQ